MALTRVHVMRHGEVHNPEGILYGRLPGYRLSERGQSQAQAVADALAHNDIAAVIASPLQRAQETATPIAAAHGLVLGTDDQLIESANYFEGKRMSPGDGVWKNPQVWWQVRNPLTPSWGEPYKEIAARMTAAVHRARSSPSPTTLPTSSERSGSPSSTPTLPRSRWQPSTTASRC
mgnify:CR=1 FL=1